ncbi:MAG TPA: phosphoenolpyruvate--protein phosphotransferase [Solirubrobacteraceae bacterium]|nr:phosphoenolpyruvate--protein phosphotransferase [Solirubrobacteraceae bacterium]
MVGIVVVSHSRGLADGAVALAREMGGAEIKIESAGGLEDPGALGTDAERVRAAIERAMSDEGVLVLMDLGSAVMSAEFAVEMLGAGAERVRLSAGPLVEGAVAAAAAAAGGAPLDEVATQAAGALQMKAAQLPDEAPAGETRGEHGGVVGQPPDAEAELPVVNEIGLHARPAARLGALARGFDADVTVGRAGEASRVRATSLTGVIALGARRGDTLSVAARGPQAREAVDALRELAATGFGDGPATETRPVPAASPARSRGPSSVPTPAPPGPGSVLRGIAASAGVAVGPARQLRRSAVLSPPPERAAETPTHERERLERAIDEARAGIRRDRDSVAARAGRAEADILDVQVALLDDEALLEPAEQAITRGATAERAWYDAAETVAGIYRGLDEPLLRERATDVLDVGRRVVEALTGAPPEVAPGGGIVIVSELTPGDAAMLDSGQVTGIATAHGAATAHAAILARALGIPAVVGLGDAVVAIGEGAQLLLDGGSGTVVVEPSPAAAREAQERAGRLADWRAAAALRAHEVAATRDGTRIEVFANIGGAADAHDALANGAEGVGLLRTEFLYLDRHELPDEHEQAETLRRIAATLEGRPLVVRTLDAGADKPLAALPMPAELNPFLGVRGIRLSLVRRDVLATQLRALLRVAADFPVKAMFPMVATLDEILDARAALDQARADTGIDAPLKTGIMVEVPAAALTSARLAEHVDFFSLGTNDLTQYTMAAERGDERLAALLSGFQPAVLRLVRETVQGATAHGRWVGVCGEFAGDPAAAILLVGLGVTELSMAPALIPEVKATLRAVDLAEARDAARAALASPTAEQARAIAAGLLPGPGAA